MVHQDRLPGWLACRSGKITLKRSRAIVVREMIEWAISGMSDCAIAAKLDEAKVPTWGPSLLWSRATVGKIFRDSRLTTEPALIGKSEFENLQRVRASKKKLGRGGGDGSNVYGNLLWSGFDPEQAPIGVVGRRIRKNLKLHPTGKRAKSLRLWSFDQFDRMCRSIVGAAVKPNLANASLRIALNARVSRISVGFARESKFFEGMVNSTIDQLDNAYSTKITDCLKSLPVDRSKKITDLLRRWKPHVIAATKLTGFRKRTLIFKMYQEELFAQFLNGNAARSERGLAELKNPKLRLIQIDWRCPKPNGEFARIGAVLGDHLVAVGRYTPYGSFWRFVEFSTALVEPGTVPEDIILPPILPFKKSAATVA